MGSAKDWIEDNSPFRQVLDNLHEGVQIIDFSWTYVYVNNVFLTYSSYPKEQLIGFTVFEKFPGFDKTPLFRILKDCMENRTLQQIESEFHLPDKTVFPVQLSIQPVPQGVLILSADLREKRLAELSLKQAEISYREIFDNTTDVIFVFDPATGKIADVNRRATEFTGLSRERLLDRGMGDMTAGMDKSERRKAVAHLKKASGGEPQIFECSCCEPGRESWFEVHAKLARLCGREQLLVFFRDITDRKLNEEKVKNLNGELQRKVAERTAELEKHISRLRESEEKFQKAFYASSAGMAITKLPDFRYAEVNDSFCLMTGYSREELIGKTSVEAGMVVETERRDALLDKIRQQGFSRHTELSIKSKSGEIRHILTSAETIGLNTDKFAISIVFDITERRKMEDQIKKSDELFTRLFEINPASLVISRLRDGLILNVNKAFLDLLDFDSKEQVTGRTASQLGIIADDGVRNQIGDLIRDRTKVLQWECMLRTRKNASKWVSNSIIITEIDNEECFLTVLLDMTDRKLSQEQLEAVNRELEAFTYSVSHDLRAPLRAANGYAEVLLEDYGPLLDDEGKKVINIIRSNTVRMGQLIDDLLDFSRLGKKPVSRTETDMEELTHNAWAEIQRQTRTTAHISIGKLPVVRADYNLLYQVMINLLGNAVKYSQKKETPEIKVRAELQGNELVFSVKDNGAGFDMEYAGKLFGVFQRLHSREEFEGTGVGLAIVHRIISKHGGRIWAKGEQGSGASFYFTLGN